MKAEEASPDSVEDAGTSGVRFVGRKERRAGSGYASFSCSYSQP